VPRKKSPDFGPDNWKALTTWIAMICDLDDAKFRVDVANFATAIEHEGHGAHRHADVLDGLSMFQPPSLQVKLTHYARSAVVARLKRWGVENKRHLRVAEGRLDQLVEVTARGQLRQQAAVLLDAAQLIRMNLQWHEEQLKKLRPLPTGRIPSVAKSEVLIKMREWEVGPTEMSERLHEAGIRGKGFKPRPLTTDRSRRRPEPRKKKK